MIVDARGLECPEPKRCLLAAIAGSDWREISFLVDSGAALDSARSLLDVQGYSYTVERRERHWELSIRRGTTEGAS